MHTIGLLVTGAAGGIAAFLGGLWLSINRALVRRQLRRFPFRLVHWGEMSKVVAVMPRVGWDLHWFGVMFGRFGVGVMAGTRRAGVDADDSAQWPRPDDGV